MDEELEDSIILKKYIKISIMLASKKGQKFNFSNSLKKRGILGWAAVLPLFGRDRDANQIKNTRAQLVYRQKVSTMIRFSCTITNF